MSDSKRYPEEAREVRALVESRRHFLNVIYALAIIQTFQLCVTAGWYSYLGEAYFHLADSSEHFVYIVSLFGQFFGVSLLYIAIYVRKNAIMGFMVLFYFAAAAMKLVQLSTFYPDPSARARFSALTRHSEYDVMSLIYDAAMFATSLLNCFMSGVATWHYTPLVLVKMRRCTSSWERAEARNALRRARRTRTTTYTVTSSDSSEAMEIGEYEAGNSYKTKISHRKNVKGTVNGGAQVIVTNAEGATAAGGKYDELGKKLEDVPPRKCIYE